MLSTLIVLVRILVNPVSNVFQKQLAQRSADPVFIITSVHALLGIVALPILLRPSTPDLSGAFWLNISVAAALAVTSNVLLVHALRSADLSVLGPVNAYKSVVSLVLAFFLVGERPTIAGLAGIGLIVAGSTFIMDRPADRGPHRAVIAFLGNRAIQWRLLALLLSATEAVFLKRALVVSDPLATVGWWAALGIPCGAVALMARERGRLGQDVRLFRLEWPRFAGLAATTGVMQLTTLLTFGTMQVGYALALFQLSALVSVFLGHRFFRETNIRRRLIGSAIMVAGAMVIVALGRR